MTRVVPLQTSMPGGVVSASCHSSFAPEAIAKPITLQRMKQYFNRSNPPISRNKGEDWRTGADSLPCVIQEHCCIAVVRATHYDAKRCNMAALHESGEIYEDLRGRYRWYWGKRGASGYRRRTAPFGTVPRADAKAGDSRCGRFSRAGARSSLPMEGADRVCFPGGNCGRGGANGFEYL